MSDGARQLIEQGFHRFEHRATVMMRGRPFDIVRPVFHAGTGPALLVMHELPGLAQPCVDLAKRLIDQDFEVFMPQLVGPALHDRTACNYLRMCMSDTFARLRSGESAPITDWLRHLARHVIDERRHPRIGAIGMCLSGAFVIPLLLETGVHAVVASQPGVPFRLARLLFGGNWGGGDWERQLNVSDDDLAAAARVARDEGKAVIVQRFAEDRICPRSRTDRLAQAFGNQAVTFNDESSPRRPRKAIPPHALLTEEFDLANRPDLAPPTDPTRVALQRVVEFFDGHLR